MALNGFRSCDVENDFKPTVFCPRREDQEQVLNNCCKTCEETAGQDCGFRNFKHDRHLIECLGVKSGVESFQKADIGKLQDKIREFENGIQEIDQRSNDIARRLEYLKDNVYQFVDDLIDSLHRRKDELVTKAEAEGKKSLERLKDQKNQLLTGMQKLDATILQVESAIRRNSGTEIAQCTQNLEQNRTKELIDKEGCLCPTENIHFKFRSSCEILSAVDIGTLQISRSCPGESTAEGEGLAEAFAGRRATFVVVTRNNAGKQVYCPGDRVTAIMKDRDSIDTHIEDNRNGTYSVYYLAKEPGSCDISVMLNGTPVRGMPMEPITVMQRWFRPMSAIGQQGTNQGEFRKPWGVATNERDEVAVADLGNNRIQILTSEGEIIRCFGKAGSSLGEFNGPCDICWGNGGEILVSDSGNHRIQIFNDTGKFIKTFGKEGNLNGDLYFPHGVSTDCHGNILVADTGNKRIQIFSPEGKFKSIIGRGHDLSCPMSCIFTNDRFIVSDFHDHQIKIFDREGHFLYKFGTKGQKAGELNCPAGLALDKSGNLLVCDRGNCRIELFKLDGTFRGEFGTSGSELGQFLFPCSVSTLTDGRFVVSDLENGRLQIFE